MSSFMGPPHAVAPDGAPLPKVQSKVRHANLNTTMIYYHEVDRVEDPAEGYADCEENMVRNLQYGLQTVMVVLESGSAFQHSPG
jgi:hypothetical protein